MKKSFFVPGLTLGMYILSLTVHAEGFSVFQNGLDVLNWMLIGALALFVLGLALIFLSMTPNKRTQDEEDYDYGDDAARENLSSEQAAHGDVEDAASPQEAGTMDEDKPASVKEAHNTDSPETEAASDTELKPESVVTPETVTKPEPEITPETENAFTKGINEPAAEDETDDVSAKSTPEDENAQTESQTQPVPVRITLTGINNPDIKVLSLTNTATLGRKSTNDLVFADSAVSSRHAILTLKDDLVYLEDSNSTNGTIVNGKRLYEKIELHTGDVLRLGHREYRIGF